MVDRAMVAIQCSHEAFRDPQDICRNLRTGPNSAVRIGSDFLDTRCYVHRTVRIVRGNWARPKIYSLFLAVCSTATVV